MQFGIDEQGNRVAISKADKEKEYHCPCCGERLIQKRGKIVIHHFAHKTLENCVSYYDNKGEWHRAMQELFPERNREIYNDEFGKHFYDVLADNGRIIEFQHSAISLDSFHDRTEAYIKHYRRHGTYKPIWVFDFTSREIFADNRDYASGRFVWNRPSKLFCGDDGTWKQWNNSYELWIRYSARIPKRDENLLIRCGVEYESISRLTSGKPFYIKVSGIYHDKYIYGKTFSEKEFEQEIRRCGGMKEQEIKERVEQVPSQINLFDLIREGVEVSNA